jgi:hypothetical protein
MMLVCRTGADCWTATPRRAGYAGSASASCSGRLAGSVGSGGGCCAAGDAARTRPLGRLGPGLLEWRLSRLSVD